MNFDDPAIAVLAELVKSRHEEYVRRFTAIDKSVASVGDDVKSLLATRSFTKGIWKTVTVISALVSFTVTGVLGYLKLFGR